MVKMFEEQEAVKVWRVEGRSGCGGCEVELWSSIIRKTWMGGELHQMRRKAKK
jgi:hypothetical protein